MVNYVITSRAKPFSQDINELILSLPGRHHHGIQYSPENSHWHIPIVDRLNTWLCLSLEKTPNFIQGDLESSSGTDHGKEFEWKGFEGDNDDGVTGEQLELGYHRPSEGEELDQEKI